MNTGCPQPEICGPTMCEFCRDTAQPVSAGLTDDLLKDIEFAIALAGRTHPQRAEEMSLRLAGYRALLSAAQRDSQPVADTSADARDPIRVLIEKHQAIIDAGNNYAYFELAYTRQTGWGAWITDKPLTGAPVVNPDRKVLFSGQGDTPEEACRAAIAASKEPTQ